MYCPMWVSKAARGCDDWLKLNCPLSCSICRPTPDKPLPRTISSLLNASTTTCTDRHSHCSYWANTRQCTINPKFMLAECCKQCTLITRHHIQARFS
ncbi:unnamed protein product [Cylicocyclus nassatus]|uniref:ShKT domain-containing protein n=1 Tax=Cylicocyclus nassatus TaxID=53992 RepID=A0AA36ME51_CYLNA|nr:unnamed protein product [Cylicocyclus nassatus]